VESIPLVKNCEKAVAVLNEKKCRVGIVSDSYTVAANMVKDRLAMDFVCANDLEFVQDKATGRVGMPLGWEKIGCFCKISVCKRYHLEEQARRYGVQIDSTMAVGDTKSDICMLQRAAIGIAFMPKDDSVLQATPNVVREPDLLKVLEFGN
jgi:phosphoserine phosphatase